MSTKITGTVTSTVTLGTGLFSSPLTITSSGLIKPSSYGAYGIVLPTGRAGTATLVNDGRILASPGAYSEYAGSFGGSGILMESAIDLVNAGTIMAGSGGNSGGEIGEYKGGTGGFGAVFYSSLASVPASSMTNTGAVIGGAGGFGEGEGGDGGAGLFVLGVSIAVSNTGGIRGGAGGEGYFYQGGRGGVAVEMFSGSMFNFSSITGGAGGFSYANNGGAGGSGAFIVEGAALTNTGIITGGAGGNTNNGHGGEGGYGVGLEAGGTLINAGTITGAAGGYSYYYHSRGPAGVAVAIYIGGTVVAEDGAVFDGTVIATDTMTNNVLVVAGTSGAVLNGIGTQFINFNSIAFAAGAIRGIEGDSAGLANGQTITGFVAGDTIILDGYEVESAGAQTVGLVLVSNFSSPIRETLALGGNLTGDFIGLVANGNTTITTTASTDGIVLKSGFEEVTNGGFATATTIGAEGCLNVSYDGYVKDAVINHTIQIGGFLQFGLEEEFGGRAEGTVLDSRSLGYIEDSSMTDTLIKKASTLFAVDDSVLSNTTIEGGTLISGGSATGYIDFSGKGGVLEIAKPPAAVISGFAAGDQIVFSNTPYAAGDNVTVETAGEVTVNLNGVSVDLAVAGAKKGEKDFKLSSGTYGATLTRKGGKSAAMGFLTPPPTSQSGATALPSLASITVSQQKPVPSANGWVASALPQPAAIPDLLRVPHGGIQTMVTLQPG